jgi:hypothetical protein
MRAEEFFNTDLGRYILGRSRQEASEAMDRLRYVQPEDAAAIRKYQMEIKIAEAAVTWLSEVIIQGRQALQIIDGAERI